MGKLYGVRNIETQEIPIGGHGMHFQNLKFFKNGKEIGGQCNELIEKNQTKEKEKRKELEKLCKEYKIDVIDLLTFSADEYLSNRAALSTGADANMPALPSQEYSKLQQLAHRIKELKSENEQLSMVSRNIDGNASFELNFMELEYLEF